MYVHCAFQIDRKTREIKSLSENRLAERESDNLMPFRQQAATVIRIKETAAEQLDDLTKSIRDVDTQVAHKQAELQQRVGESYLRGEDLKQYINMLKAKSSVYKKQRAELSALEVNKIILFMMNCVAHWSTLCTHTHTHSFSLQCVVLLAPLSSIYFAPYLVSVCHFSTMPFLLYRAFFTSALSLSLLCSSLRSD